MRFFLTTVILTTLAQSVWAGDQFKSYEDCLIKSLKGVTNNKAVGLINEACLAAFDSSQITNLEQIAALKTEIEKLQQENAVLQLDLKRAKAFDPSKEIEAIIQRKIKEREAECEQVSKPSSSGGSNDQIPTLYREFPGTFTTNLAGSRKMLQVGIGVSTQYDDTVIMNVESHQLALRSVILGVISDFSEGDVKGETGRTNLSEALREAINAKLEMLENFGGVEGVHFTSFVLQ